MRIKKRAFVKIVWIGIVFMVIVSTLAWTASLGM
jgi:hypothetical protein